MCGKMAIFRVFEKIEFQPKKIQYIIEFATNFYFIAIGSAKLCTQKRLMKEGF
jgi:hypothetical protein